jgi:hypothetical protein
MKRHSLICRFTAEDEQPISVSEHGSTVTEILFVSDEGTFDYGLGGLLGRLGELGLQPSEAAFDLTLLAALVFCADVRINRESDSQDGWSREMDLYVPVHDVARWTSESALLSRTLRFLTGDEWRIFFRQRPEGFDSIVPQTAPALPRFSCAALFSGGLDSYIGAIDRLDAGETPLLVSHYMDGASEYQKKCFANLQREYPKTDFDIARAYVSFKADTMPGSTGESTQRSRSFLFFALGILAASGLGQSRTLYVPENGLIALNVALDPLRVGALSTRTTHPFYMARVNELLGNVGIPVTLENPYRHMTKGEMIAAVKNQPLLRRSAKDSMSCSSPAKGRFEGLPRGHCGHCVPCLIRRAAMIRGFSADDTGYQIPDLAGANLKAKSAKGEHVRSFQYAIQRLHQNPASAGWVIHSPGPLGDVPTEWPALSAVYSRGLAEVENVVRGIPVQAA